MQKSPESGGGWEEWGWEEKIITEQKNGGLEITIKLKARMISLNRNSLFIPSYLSWRSLCVRYKTWVTGDRAVKFPELAGVLGAGAHSGALTEMPQGFNCLGGSLPTEFLLRMKL